MYPCSRLYAIGDNAEQLALLSEKSLAAGTRTRVLLDINMGMNRTGVPLDQGEAVYRACAALPGLEMVGLHGYDGHRLESDFAERAAKAGPSIEAAHALRDRLARDGIPCGYLVMGGTPSFPVHARQKEEYLSPGTVFLADLACGVKSPELPFVPAAAIVARVVSHPAAGLFTLDVGTKAIAAEMAGPRGAILGLEDAEAVLQSEEHWVFRAAEESLRPAVGEVLLVFPTHICPTNALYSHAAVIRDGKVFARWEIAARGRSIGI